MNKKIGGAVLAMGLIFSMVNVGAFAQDNVKIMINQVAINANTFIENGRVMIPLRVVTEELGCDVIWYAEKSQIVIRRPGIELQFTIGENVMQKNGSDISMDVAPVIINDRTYVPLRTVQEALNDTVKWDNDTRTVYIDSEYVKNPFEELCKLKRTFEVVGKYHEEMPIKIDVEVPRIEYNEHNDELEKINKYLYEESKEQEKYIEDKTNGIFSSDMFDGRYSYEIQYNKKDIFSILAKREIWASGGMHRLSTERLKSFGYVFSKKTGEKLEITDILKGDLEEIKNIVKNNYKKLLEGNAKIDIYARGEFKELDFMPDVEESIRELVFYVNNGNLVFVWDVFDGGSMETGILKYEINIEENEDMFTEQFLTYYYGEL